MKKSLLLLVTLLACLSAWAEDVNLTEDTNEDEGTAARWYVNMPAGSLESWLTLTDASITTFKVYDNGGKNENYSNGCNSLLHITAPTGYIIQLSGRIKTETSWDKLTVYDSNEASGIKLLDAINGKNSSWLTINTVRSTGQSMTLFFYSDGSSNYEGLDLTVELINPNAKYNITVNPANNGIVESDKIEAKTDEVVTLTASPFDGYVLDGLIVKDGRNNIVAVDWITYLNTAYFIMPASAVTVTPTFSNDPSRTSDTPYVNMPQTGTKNITIPAGLMSFKVYDDGGKDGYYNRISNGFLTLTAPEGYNLRVSGTITAGGTNTIDQLNVFDGIDNTAPKLIDQAQSSSWYSTTPIPTVTSTGQSVTLGFIGYEDRCQGLDLTIELVSTSTEYAITVNNPDQGGTVTADFSYAVVGQTVTLTSSPDEGYVLTDLIVTDVNNKVMTVTDMIWYAGTNTATFSMPASAVTVTPTFSNDLTSLYIDMPQTGIKTAVIPKSIVSFKVYDDGGAEDRYSFSCDGALAITAPEGYQLQLSGNIMTSQEDYFTVYDNNEPSGTKLLDTAVSDAYDVWTAIPTVTSTRQIMTLYFYSDSSAGIAGGLDLTVTLVPPAHEHVLGDLNGDDVVDVADVNICINVVLETNTDPDIIDLSDLNGDGTADVADVNMIINIIMSN